MKQLLDGMLAPLTFSIGFLDFAQEAASRAFAVWTSANHRGVTHASVAGTLAEMLAGLEPLTTPPRRKLFLSTQSGWTAYFDNGKRGADPRTPIAYLSRHLKCRGVVAMCIPQTLGVSASSGGTYGAVSFELFGPKETDFLNYERSVSVANDGGKWRFDQFGSVQPFEDVMQYQNRRVQQRFAPESLEKYCAALGIALFDEQFYCGPGM